MTEQQACTLYGAGGHAAAQCNMEMDLIRYIADLDDQGNPVRTCVGHAKAMKQDATK
ncbi:hypothetical protein LZL12_15710 [Pseudomonas aeruginosa]|uniref:hypothetical protein n=1 Tax=Pseudomonas aeruginosa TaxID=287 RepID=UPI0021B024F3|nr:hypothetical protein [Pseudomonas aeruginosa]MDP5671804.1 hypothetical protein [Pseudomonas aeruginosa]